MSFAINPPSAFSLVPTKDGDYSPAIQGLRTLRQLAQLHAPQQQYKVGLEREVATRADDDAAAYFANAPKEDALPLAKRRATATEKAKVPDHFTRAHKRNLRRKKAAAQRQQSSGKLPV